MDLFHVDRQPKKVPTRMHHLVRFGYAVTTKKTSELVINDTQLPIKATILSTGRKPTEEKLIHSDYIRTLTNKVIDLVLEKHFDNTISKEQFERQFMVVIDIHDTRRFDNPVLSMQAYRDKRAKTLTYSAAPIQAQRSF